VDKWYRDNRIDYDVQLNDDYYAKSGFDRGHLARREDAEWGTTVAKAKLAADMTCSYANAAPQVPTLNRATFGYHGRWGQLEQELLEKGVENESGKAGRICVFAGPLFDGDDPVFKGVQVALDFYKIVVWYDGTGTLRTTCFRLSQTKLVGQIEFEVLRFDEVFKSSQIPIGTIEEATGLQFHQNIVSRDTSDGHEQPIE
jgi:endonuclease G